VKLAAEGYLQEGTLTVFTGIPFNKENPYNYPDAKRLLGLMMDDLKGTRALIRSLKINPKLKGRGAITGKKTDLAVWDILNVREMIVGEKFRKYPHLTLAIEKDRLLALLTFPSQSKTSYRRNLTNLGHRRFFETIESITRNLKKSLVRDKGASPRIIMLQRRYPSRTAVPFYDARIDFDLRTAFGSRKRSRSNPIQDLTP